MLYPFVAPSELDDTVVARLGQALAVVSAFWCSFERCGWFGNDVLYLAPVPAEPFQALTAAVGREFPQHPPYGGAYAEVVPHLTVGDRADVRALRAAEVAVTGRLPVRALVDRVTVIAGAPVSGSWHTTHEVPLSP